MSIVNSGATPESRRQVEEFAKMAGELRQELSQVQSRVERARVALSEGNDGAARDLAAAANERDRIQIKLDDVESGRRSLLGHLAPGRAAWSGSSLFEDSQTVHTLEQMGNSRAPIGSVMLGQVASREELMGRMRGGVIDPSMRADDSAGGVVSIGSQTDPARTGPWYGIVPQTRRRLAILAAIPTATMDHGSFSYTQESGSFDFAAETAELATKPAGEVNFEDAECVARTIPAWLKVPRQQLADVPMLQQTLQGRLMYAVMRRIENQILSGDGTGENLQGILNTTGIGTVAFDADEPLSDLTLDAITTVLVSEAVPDLAVFNPLDLATMQKAKAVGSGERLDSEGAFASTASTIWDLPRVASTAMPQGTALVGDFALGATLFIREGVNVRASDSDQDDFVKNRMTLLGEARVGLAIWNPTCFAEVALAA